MAEQKLILTKDGYKKLEDQLQYNISVRRNEVAEQIAYARGFGDLSENAEYDAAKAEQAKLEDEIQQLEEMLRTAKVVDESEIRSDRAGIGTTVTVRDEEEGDEDTYSIVGANESNPRAGLISVDCPIGMALNGHQVGDRVEVTAPGGSYALMIVKIERTVK